jgi:hypothetical protein
MRIGHSHVTGKRISVSLQKSLLDERGRLADGLEAQLKVAVYLPSSGAYGNLDMPDNIHRYLTDVPPEEVVKLVGDTKEACIDARNILEVIFAFHGQMIELLMLGQDWITTKLDKVTPVKHSIPGVLYGFIKVKMDTKFRVRFA